MMERRFSPFTRTMIAALLAAALALAQSTNVCAQSAKADKLDTTTPNVFTNLESTDVGTKMLQLQEQLDEAKQEILFSNLLRQYESQMTTRRFYYASGNALVPAYLFTPKPLDTGKHYPGLVIIHGGWHSQLEWGFFDLISYAIGKGYVVMFPEYRSSAGYGEDNRKSNFGVTDIADVLAAADYLSKVPYVDTNRLGIFGHSRGGMLTLMAVERAPKKFKAAVDVAGLADLVAFMSYKADWRRQETASEPYFGGKLPSEDLGPYIELSPINHVDEIEAPLFLAATTGDKTVPFPLHLGRVIDALKARNKVFETKIYDHAPGDHMFIYGDTPERKDLLERSFAFLGKYLEAAR